MAGWAEKRVLLSLVRLKLSVCPDSSVGPAEIPVAQPAMVCAPESSSTAWSAPLTKLGASLTGLTVIDTVAVFESSSPSLTLKLKLSAPLKSGSGV